MSNQSNPASNLATATLAIDRLIEIVARLRSPDGGCPWDLAQTPESLTPYIIEEAYETVAAIKSAQQSAIAEELGDLLLQVVLQAQIASEYGHFSLKEVALGIGEKLIRRHPHVFNNLPVEGIEGVRENWEKIKAAEKGEDPQVSQLLSRQLSRYQRSLPPLTAGMKISQKAAAVGFEWENAEGVWDKFTEELAEFREAIATGDRQHASEELGDLLFTVINLARWYQIDPDEALAGTNQRFVQRLAQMEAFVDRPLAEYTLEELENFWQQAKQMLKNKADEA
jgi:XTP/dITP diphosphohydrolase